MAHFHPSNELLAEYVAGSLSPAYLACISSHLHYCPECRQHVDSQQHVAGIFLEELSPVPVSDDVLESIMSQIDSGRISRQDNYQEQSVRKTQQSSGLPSIVEKLASRPLDELEWEPVIKGISIHHLKVGDVENELSLYKIESGYSIPHHAHKGDELMQLLKGSFSDQRGVYLSGDFVECNPSFTHAPVAAEGQPCICLVALSAPLRFTGAFRRLANPFLKIHPQ